MTVAATSRRGGGGKQGFNFVHGFSFRPGLADGCQ
jgi:hypothetical protein